VLVNNVVKLADFGWSINIDKNAIFYIMFSMQDDNIYNLIVIIS